MDLHFSKNGWRARSFLLTQNSAVLEQKIALRYFDFDQIEYILTSFPVVGDSVSRFERIHC